MKPTAKYQIINHGMDHEQYFPGCGCACTPYDRCVTGCGESAAEAYQDALDCVYTDEGSKADSLDLPNKPRGLGITSRPVVPASAEDFHYYVSILYTITTEG